ncbi:MAG: amylo-alpha-1,6-glucosidase [Dehalococcoidia bacterium]
MTVEIKVGPPVLTINRGSTFMVTDQNGEIDQNQAQGVFAEDTRFISTYNLYINEKSWERVTSAVVAYYAARLELTNPEVLRTDGQGSIEARTIALTLDREINGALTESFHVANYSLVDVTFMLELAFRSDFADSFEVKAGRLLRRGDMKTKWDEKTGNLTTVYRNQDFVRQLVYRVDHSDSQANYANGRLAFKVSLPAGGTWDARCQAELLHRGRPDWSKPSRKRSVPGLQSEKDLTSGDDLEQYQQEWTKACTAMETANDNVRNAYKQSVEDMGALRMPEHDLGPDVWVPAAGVPWFVTLFGRDSLIVSYQNMMVHAAFAAGALRELARYQAKERDNWRDAQPGKILHELRHGELAFFHKNPFTPYYGTADATILYLIILHEHYKWTGDRKLLEELHDVALGCLEWIDQSGDLDGDGFQEYKTFSDQGFDNMAWKDSGDAVVYADGSQVKQPKALCELQGYVYDAKTRMAEVFDALGDHDRATALRQQAVELQQKFDAQFWMEDEACYAFGLDPEKKQITSVASNAGQCLWTGIVLRERAQRLVRRLQQPDMWCGWGIRTLSSKNPAYNPYSYQRGSVWPHDNGIIAAGMKRYGFADEANKVAEGIFAAASYFENLRLPEVFSGLERRPASFPSQYIGANIPQAWASGSVFHLLRTILGLRADAPNGVLYVQPTLPDWLPEVRLQSLKLGVDEIDLHFWRDGKDSHFEVTNRTQGQIEVKLEGSEIPIPWATGIPEPDHTRRPARAHSAPGQTKGSGSASQPSAGKGAADYEIRPGLDADGKPASSVRGEENPMGGGAPTGSSPSPSPNDAARPHDTPDQSRAEQGKPS